MANYIEAFRNPDASITAHREAVRMADLLAHDVDYVEGVAYWKASGACIPEDCARFAHALGYPVDMLAHLCERTAATERTFAAIRRARARMSEEQRAEEAAERRAAFGPGVEVVNIVTGERFIS